MKYFAAGFKPVLTVSHISYICRHKPEYLRDSSKFLTNKTILHLLMKNSPFDKYSLICKHNLRKADNVHESDSQIKKKIQVETSRLLANRYKQLNDKSIFEKIKEFRSDSNIISGFNIGAIKNQISRERGKQHEEIIRDEVNKSLCTNFLKNNSILQIDANYFKMRGRIDGVDDLSKSIIEVKSRAVLEFDSEIHLSDRIQCLCYMKLANLSRCVLVESDLGGCKKFTEILFDEDQFNELVQTNLMLFINACKNIKEMQFVSAMQKTTLRIK